ncbi:MAG: hypothetical protein LBT41_00265 [Candidatus Methanoplasma sp.]|jgi:FtsH-binding integral membrane protein|nr:hypothetical protein [Candidatus Methanoplasma sp.]
MSLITGVFGAPALLAVLLAVVLIALLWRNRHSSQEEQAERKYSLFFMAAVMASAFLVFNALSTENIWQIGLSSAIAICIVSVAAVWVHRKANGNVRQ